MNWLLIYVLLALCLWLILLGMRRPGAFYEFPFLAGASIMFFVMPQLPALASDPFLPPGAFAKTAAFTILCAGMCGIGWAAGTRPMIGMSWRFDERRLLWVAAIFSLIGAFFFYKLSRLPEELLEVSNWTGLPVAYLFIATLFKFGFVIALLSFLGRPSMLALAIILYGASVYAAIIIDAGRRAGTAEFVLMIAAALWFQKGLAAPRVVALVGILAAALAIPSTGAYRTLSRANDGWPGWSKVEKIDVWSNFEELLRKGGAEMRNALERIDFIDRTQNFDYGAWNWNELVFNYVPAQILGSEFKDSLMIPLGERQFDPNYESQITLGSTTTGMADAFASFWYFGAFKFFLIAYFLGRIYRAAIAGNTVYQIVYAVSMIPAMEAITHETQVIFSKWVYIALLVLPFLAFARVNPPIPMGMRHSALRRPVAGMRFSGGLR